MTVPMTVRTPEGCMRIGVASTGRSPRRSRRRRRFRRTNTSRSIVAMHRSVAFPFHADRCSSADQSRGLPQCSPELDAPLCSRDESSGSTSTSGVHHATECSDIATLSRLADRASSIALQRPPAAACCNRRTTRTAAPIVVAQSTTSQSQTGTTTHRRGGPHVPVAPAWRSRCCDSKVPHALRRYVYRTRMIYNFSYFDFAPKQ